MDYFKKAADQHQYDKEEMNWGHYGEKDDPVRLFYQRILLDEIKTLKGKRVLDVGSGSGAFFEFYHELGAAYILGIEPSKINCEISRKISPDVQVINAGLLETDLKEEFDAVFAVMVFEHLADLSKAYEKIRSLLKKGGSFYLIFQDLEYLKDPRYSSPISFEEGEDGTVVARVQSPRFGTVYDLLRTPERYIESAEQSGFILEKHKPLFPDDELCKMIPKYVTLRERPFRHLLILRK